MTKEKIKPVSESIKGSGPKSTAEEFLDLATYHPAVIKVYEEFLKEEKYKKKKKIK